MNIFRVSMGSSEAKRVAVRCVFAIGVVCWANFPFFAGILFHTHVIPAFPFTRLNTAHYHCEAIPESDDTAHTTS